MTTERARLKRLQRLERIRAVAKRAAAAEAASAEGARSQLEALAARTLAMASDYARRSEPTDGAALQQLVRFAGGLQGISASTASDAAQARHLADAKLALLAQAERHRSAIADRAESQARALAKVPLQPASGPRRGFGTGLE